MSPAEAGAVELEEPDWKERFESECQRWPRLPRYLQEDSAFESILSQWRKFHFTWLEVEINGKVELKHKPAPVIDGMVALAKLKIFPPRSLIRDIPHDGATGYQADDHVWLSVAGEQWRITAVEDRIMILERMLEDKPETKQIDLTKAKWSKYVEAACAVIEAQRAPENATTPGP